MKTYRTEAEFRDECSRLIALSGITARTEVSNRGDAGETIIADILANDVAVECKVDGANDVIMKAIGQCFAYTGNELSAHAAIAIPRYLPVSMVMWIAAHQAGIAILTEDTIAAFVANPARPTQKKISVLLVSYLCYVAAGTHYCYENETPERRLAMKDGMLKMRDMINRIWDALSEPKVIA